MRRNERNKTFALGRGLYQTVIYPERVHYRDGEGGWGEIDNRLKPAAKGGPGLENSAGPLRIRLGAFADAVPLVMLRDREGRGIRWRLEGASDTPAVQEAAWQPREDEDENRAHGDKAVSAVRYAGALPHTDLICELRGDGLKETLVLHSPEAPGRYVYSFEIGELAQATDGAGRVTTLAKEIQHSLNHCPRRRSKFHSLPGESSPALPAH